MAGDGGLVERLGGAIAAARAAGVPVVFVRAAFRPGYPEVSARKRSFAAIAAQLGRALGEGDDATQIHSALGVLPDDPVVVKKRASRHRCGSAGGNVCSSVG